MLRLLLLFLLWMVPLCSNSLLLDLETAAYWDRKLQQRFPLTFNHILSTGYFTTPSARMGEEGEIGFGVAHAPPYLNWNARIQVLTPLELSANYRIFWGVEDQGLSPHGFGYYADRGANIKWALMTPEESSYDFPGVAIGVEDFMGSKKFNNYFAVLTKVWPSYGLETSLGWGKGRFSKGWSSGFFAGCAYFPWWECDFTILKGLGVAFELDPINYSHCKSEPHPFGRTSRFPINAGLKYKVKDLLDFSASYIRGSEFAIAGSLNFNLGKTQGFLPKMKDPPFYIPPEDASLGCYNDDCKMMENLEFVLENQGFRLTKGWIENGILWIGLINQCYRSETKVKERLEYILGALIPPTISCTIVIIESVGLPCQQYVYPTELVNEYGMGFMGRCELDIMTPREEFTDVPESHLVYYRRLDPWRLRISPRVETFFGSAKGKVKYDFGVKADLEGFLPLDIFYELQFSYTLLSTVNDVTDFDFYNPSQLPNVLTDYVNYRKRRIFSTDRAYIQKNWNLGSGWFSKAALGYFQVNYAGCESEFLYYPVNCNYAFGVEGALLKKRRYTGLWFQSKLRELEGFKPTYKPYFLLSQYFLNFYLDIPTFKVATKLSAGSFLANDKGFQIELTRYFESGLRIKGWMTFTNAGDQMHNENYYNRGIALEMPLDLFFRRSSRRVWNYGLAAWLRDAGAFIPVGKSLFDILNQERRF